MGIQVDVTNFICSKCRQCEVEARSIKDVIQDEITKLDLSITEKTIQLPFKEPISDSPICESNDAPLDFGHGAELLKTTKIDDQDIKMSPGYRMREKSHSMYKSVCVPGLPSSP